MYYRAKHARRFHMTREDKFYGAVGAVCALIFSVVVYGWLMCWF